LEVVRLRESDVSRKLKASVISGSIASVGQVSIKILTSCRR